MMEIYQSSEFPNSEKNKKLNALEEVNGDVNNNGRMKSEKYSLRPRSLRQKTEKGLELKREILSQKSKKNPEASSKQKQKAPPLSKYRRKTANARERNRMREINVAFETLRRAIPHLSDSLNAGNEKLSKITTLRLAMKYIQTLRQVLESSANDQQCRQTVCNQVTLASFMDDEADLDVLLSDGESLHFNSDISENFASPDHPLTSPFSELSNSENSPDFSFPDSVVSPDFRLDENLTDSGFCDDFLGVHCLGGLS